MDRRRHLPLAIKIEVPKVGVTSKGDELKPYMEFSKNNVRQRNSVCAPCLPSFAHINPLSLKVYLPKGGQYGVAAALSIRGEPDLR